MLVRTKAVRLPGRPGPASSRSSAQWPASAGTAGPWCQELPAQNRYQTWARLICISDFLWTMPRAKASSADRTGSPFLMYSSRLPPGYLDLGSTLPTVVPQSADAASSRIGQTAVGQSGRESSNENSWCRIILVCTA